MNKLHRWLCKSDYWRTTLAGEIMPWALKGIELGDNVLEVGPGPGLTTDILRPQVARMTSIEIDPRLAESLRQRLDGTNVTVVEGDATKMPFENASFTSAVSFTMLHHVPSSALQDRLIAEVFRVLRPGGTFAGTDSIWSRMFQLMHLFDTMIVVDPESFVARLEAAGFVDVAVRRAERSFKFRAHHP